MLPHAQISVSWQWFGDDGGPLPEPNECVQLHGDESLGPLRHALVTQQLLRQGGDQLPVAYSAGMHRNERRSYMKGSHMDGKEQWTQKHKAAL